MYFLRARRALHNNKVVVGNFEEAVENGTVPDAQEWLHHKTDGRQDNRLQQIHANKIQITLLCPS